MYSRLGMILNYVKYINVDETIFVGKYFRKKNYSN